MLSATSLVKFVESDVLPVVGRAAWYDYGFANCSTTIEERCLLGVYQDLVITLGATDRELHQNLLGGTLAAYIKGKYGARTSGYYEWFLENERRIVGAPLSSAEDSGGSSAEGSGASSEAPGGARGRRS